MAKDEKRDLDQFREEFKGSYAQRIQNCLWLIDELESQTGSARKKIIASLEDELTAMEGEVQLLDFEHLSGLFKVLIETLRSASSERPALLRKGLKAVGPLVERWSAGDSTESISEGIMAALQQHLAKVPEKKKLPEDEVKRIVFIDDSKLTRDMMKLSLESEGHQVRVVADLVNFETVLKEFKPHIILTDVNMPDIRGDEICRVLKKKYATADIPIVLFSSIDPEELVELAETAGADGYVSKQQGFEELIDTIDSLINQILW
jgi:CheY-like chemotaxis protein